jgi:hypothetical protein
MYGLRVSVLEVHYSKLRDEPVTVEGFVALKARITDARHALGKRNEIAKILGLPKAQEREQRILIINKHRGISFSSSPQSNVASSLGNR